MSYRRKKKQSTRNRLASSPTPMVKSKSAPDKRPQVEWPGSIDDKYVEDVRNRLNVIEANAVSDDMIRAFLAANDCKQRHCVEALKKTVEWRKGRQMFWNNYRSQNERFALLSHTRICGKGMGSTFGHTKNGRLVFYEKIGLNFSLSLHKEFSATEFVDHLVVWAENLMNLALNNCGQSSHLISFIPYYQKEEKEEEIAINEEENKHEFIKPSIVNNCKFADCVGIIDWKGLNEKEFILNRELLIASAQLLCKHYPHLINRLYHINLPLNFENIENALRKDVPQQLFTKSIFLESIENKEKRIAFIANKKNKRNNRRSTYNALKRKRSRTNTIENKEEIESMDIVNENGKCDLYTSKELLSQISSSLLPSSYGGDCEDKDIFTFVDPIYTYLLGASSIDEVDPTGYEEYDTDKQNQLSLWTSHPLRSAERHTKRISVKRGEHYKWQFMTEYDRQIFFGLTFEADGFRGKSIKVIVRDEIQHKCGYCPLFGDFIVLKDGNLIFQFRNVKGGRRLNLQYKIDCDVFPESFINKHLPDYHAEERLLQTKTLNFGGKNQRAKSTKSPSEVSGSTAISTSPPPFTDNTHTIALNRPNNKQTLSTPSSPSKIKRAKSQRHKKSSKKIKNKKKSYKKRAKTPEPPHTPI